MATDIATVDTLKDILNGSDNQSLIQIENDIWDRESVRASSVLTEVGNIVNTDFGINSFNIPSIAQMANIDDVNVSYQNNRLSVDKTIRIKHDEITNKNSIAAIKPVETIIESLLKAENAVLMATNDAYNKLQIADAELKNKIEINNIANQAQKGASEISTVTISRNSSIQSSVSTSISESVDNYESTTNDTIINNISGG